MPEAARFSDPIGHSPTMNWLLKGLLIGAGIALAGVLIVGTGGLAAVAIVGGLAAAGAGVGEVMSTMSFAAKEVTGRIILGSRNVFIKGLMAARAHVDTTACSKHPNPPKLIATGSGNVYINGMPAARNGDKTVCSAQITAGANNVFIGGGTQQTDTLEPENLVPGWVHAALLVVGVASAVILAGPVIAIGGLVGSVAGGLGGNLFGGKLFGEGSDGQKWSMLAGSFLGGALGAKGAPKTWEFAKRVEVDPNVLGMNGGNLRLKPASGINGQLKTKDLDPHYRGEEIPGNPNSWTRGRGPVRYLSDAEKADYKLTVKNGKLYDSEGLPFDTSKAQTWDGENKAIYVMDKNGNLYASQNQKVFDFHHSSLGQGKPVSGAGEIEVRDGVLQSINDRSGHYKPTEKLFNQTVVELKAQGLGFDEAVLGGN